MTITPPEPNYPLQECIDAFWETFPPIWHLVRSHILQVATRDFDITVDQFHILRRIRHGRDSVSKLAEAKHISRSAISRSVEVLVTKGYVSRAPNPQDRRNLQLSLTEEGTVLVHELFGNARQWMGTKLSVLDSDELAATTQAMRTLKRAFD